MLISCGITNFCQLLRQLSQLVGMGGVVTYHILHQGSQLLHGAVVVAMALVVMSVFMAMTAALVVVVMVVAVTAALMVVVMAVALVVMVVVMTANVVVMNMHSESSFTFFLYYTICKE